MSKEKLMFRKKRVNVFRIKKMRLSIKSKFLVSNQLKHYIQHAIVYIKVYKILVNPQHFFPTFIRINVGRNLPFLRLQNELKYLRFVFLISEII